MDDDRFRPLSDDERQQAGTGPISDRVDDDGWSVVVPVPDTAGAPYMNHGILGDPVAFWIYRDASGARVCYVARYNKAGGEKVFLPYSYWRDTAGNLEWRCKNVPDPRPLYGLELLARRPNAVVIVTEGEKACEAARSIFTADVVVSPMKGAKSPHKADWQPLKGRDVIIWPDNDGVGAGFAVAVAGLLRDIAASIRVVDIEKLVAIDGGRRGVTHNPDGWDAADVVPEWDNLVALRSEVMELAKPYEDGTRADRPEEKAKTKTKPSAELSDAEFSARLAEAAKLDKTQYFRRRTKLAKELGVTADALDKLIRMQRGVGSEDDGLPGQPLKFDQIKPWPDPVAGEALLSELAVAIRSYVVMDDYQRDACALWAIFTHTHDLRDYAPLLIAKSALKRSGKSKLAEVLERLAPRPLYIAGLTAAFIERAIDDHRCTLIIDEADRIRKGDQALAERIDAQLNRSFKRSGARVGKNVPLPGGGYEPRLFSTWAPTFISGIGDQADTAEDRAVIVVLKRKLATEKTKPLRGKDGADLVVLARKIARWVADNKARLRSIEPVALKVDNDRAKDVWEPLLAIADIAGGAWSDRARKAGIALVGAAEEGEENIRVMLLGDIRDVFTAEFPPDHVAHLEGPGRPDGGPRLASVDLVERLLDIEDRPYNVFGKAQKRLTQNVLGRLLKGFDIRSGTVRVNNKTAKGYYLRAFEDAFARYLPPLQGASKRDHGPTPPFQNRHTGTNAGKPGESEDSKPSQNNNLCGCKIPEAPMFLGFVTM
jgi:Protein of unknown function (DUF3631)